MTDFKKFHTIISGHHEEISEIITLWFYSDDRVQNHKNYNRKLSNDEKDFYLVRLEAFIKNARTWIRLK